MLHQNMMFRFNPELELPLEKGCPAPSGDASVAGREAGLSWWLQVAGNTLGGAVFLAALVLMPAWLARLLAAF